MAENTLEQDMIQHATEWLSSHDHPTVTHLHKLAGEHTPESMERLRELADLHNVTYDSATTPRQLADLIGLAMEHGRGFDQD